MSYSHLEFRREAPLTDRHPRNHPGVKFPGDIKAHGAALADQFAKARKAPSDLIPGYDQRKLLKIRLRAGEKSMPEELSKIPGVEIVSQESHSIVLAFATDEGLTQFESRLSTLARLAMARSHARNCSTLSRALTIGRSMIELVRLCAHRVGPAQLHSHWISSFGHRIALTSVRPCFRPLSPGSASTTSRSWTRSINPR